MRDATISELDCLNLFRSGICANRTLQDIADEFGVSPQFISTVATGRRKPTKRMLGRMGIGQEIVHLHRDGREILATEALGILRGRIGYHTKIGDLAQEFGISDAFMSMVLSGKKRPTDAMLASIGIERKKVYRYAA